MLLNSCTVGNLIFENRQQAITFSPYSRSDRDIGLFFMFNLTPFVTMWMDTVNRNSTSETSEPLMNFQDID